MSPAPQQVTDVERLELDLELRRERPGRDVELLRRQRGEAALVVGDPHASAPPSGSGCPCSRRAERSLALDDARRPAAALRLSRCRRAPGPPARPAGDVGRERRRHLAAAGEATSRTSSPSAARIIPCVFGTSSVSRSQPVVLAEWTNHLACFAPMSRSMPTRIDSAPSFAIASRGSTPLGQRSLQK